MKISNPCLEDFKIKITPTKLKKHKLEKKTYSRVVLFSKLLLSFHRQPKPYDFEVWVCIIFFGKLKIILEWILSRPSFLRLQHGNWYDEFRMGKWSAGVVVGGRCFFF